jgi:glycosyltransferase involved in cell wall biosynthesis
MNQQELPFVSVCTPTFNRRPFIPFMIKCFEHQTYPKDRIEWIIVDDGTDKIEDLVSDIPQVKYYKFDEKLTLGKKRNISNEKAKGEIIVYMDDDDYYPPERITHAVETLQQNPNALCAGSSAMLIYFKDIQKMIQFGPYGPNHATAATFAFKKELLKQTNFNEEASIAEEKFFLKNYTVPFVQLKSTKSILVFSHNHNSFDKRELLKQKPNPYMSESEIVPSDIIKEKDILQFFMEDIDPLLKIYEPGRPEHKPDVIKEMNHIKEKREKVLKQKQNESENPEYLRSKLQEQSYVVQKLYKKNLELEGKVKYLEEKITEIISKKIQEKREEKIQEKIQEIISEKRQEKIQEKIQEKREEKIQEKRQEKI